MLACLFLFFIYVLNWKYTKWYMYLCWYLYGFCSWAVMIPIFSNGFLCCNVTVLYVIWLIYFSLFFIPHGSSYLIWKCFLFLLGKLKPSTNMIWIISSSWVEKEREGFRGLNDPTWSSAVTNHQKKMPNLNMHNR